MAFGRKKDEVFQRVTTVKEEAVKTPKKKKNMEEETPAPDTSMWDTNSGDRAQRVESSVPVKPQPEKVEDETNGSSTAEYVREVGSAPADTNWTPPTFEKEQK